MFKNLVRSALLDNIADIMDVTKDESTNWSGIQKLHKIIDILCI